MRNRRSAVPEIIDPEVLLQGYRAGIFPMADPDTGEIAWYLPEVRAVFPLDAVKVSRSLRHTIRSKRYEVRFDTAFEETMRMCAAREETWISETIIRSYCGLFRLRHAHSVETWSGASLVGGLYGVAIGGAFFGESMFSTMTDASKTAFVALTERLRERGFVLLDAQFMTDHLRSLGAVEISREEYHRRLQEAVNLPCHFEGP